MTEDNEFKTIAVALDTVHAAVQVLSKRLEELRQAASNVHTERERFNAAANQKMTEIKAEFSHVSSLIEKLVSKKEPEILEVQNELN